MMYLCEGIAGESKEESHTTDRPLKGMPQSFGASLTIEGTNVVSIALVGRPQDMPKADAIAFLESRQKLVP